MKNHLKRLFTILFGLILIILVTVKCKKDEVVDDVPVVEEPKPTAGFEFTTQADPLKYNEYQFTSSSTNYKFLLWNFGDDSTSVQPNPKHIYRYPGKYKVTLTTRNGQGYSAAKEILLNIINPNVDESKVGENYIKTIGGKFSVTRDAGVGPDGGEGSKKMIDEDPRTKFVQDGFDGTLKCTFELNSPQVVGAYTLTAGIGKGDADRDPRIWIFQASNDGIQYTDLQTVNTSPWPNPHLNDNPFTPIIKHIDNYVAYKFYRIYFKANRGSRLFQIGDWTINKKQP